MKLTNNKIKIIIIGILLPIVVFVTVTFLTSTICLNINKNMNPVLVQGIANTLSLSVFIPLYIIFTKINDLSVERICLKKIIYVIAIGFSLCYICNTLVNYIPRAKANVVTENVYKLSEELNVYATLIIITIIVPITEEIIFRGFFYDSIKLVSNNIVAILFTSIAFAFAHSDLQQILYAFVAGIFLSYIKYKCKNIIYSVIMHCIMNFTAYIFIPTMVFNNKNDFFTLFIMFCILMISLFRLNLFTNN